MTNPYDELSDRARWFIENLDELDIAESCATNEAAAKRAAEERDGAYRERAHLIALLAAIYPAHIGYTDPAAIDWLVVTIETPTGQMSWHIAERDRDLFEHVRLVVSTHNVWDGHNTDEKYERLRTLTATTDPLTVFPDPEVRRQLAAAIETLGKSETENAELRRRIETLEHVAAGNKRHVQLIVPDLERAEAAIARVRALRDDLQGITGARWIAEALGKILDPPGPAATQTTEPHTGLVVQPYRNDRGENVWVFRCWGTDTCDGWLSLDHYSEQSAERARDRHVTEEHGAPGPAATDTAPVESQRVTHSCGQVPHTWGCVTTVEPSGPTAAEATEPVQQIDADPDDPPVQCWHTEPGTPCDWDVCKQPEPLAAGDYGTDPREQR